MGAFRIIAHGEDVAVVIPRDVARSLNLRPGEQAPYGEHEGGLLLRSGAAVGRAPASGESADEEVSETLKIARRIMDRYDGALRALAK